jgi:hypothetical protein
MFGGLVPIDAVRSFDLPQGVNEWIIAESLTERLFLESERGTEIGS